MNKNGGLNSIKMKDDKFSILIMAGGKGTRFWPKSTETKPKQFLKLTSDKTMIQLTIERAKQIVPMERIFVVTGEKYKEILKEQITDIEDKNIIVEPTGRNTAPCIALATMYINQIYNNSNIAVLPSDHLIIDEEEFKNTILAGNKFINSNGKKGIVTIGVKPNRVETGYGYIKIDKKIDDLKNRVIKVEKFVEKPDFDLALHYLETKMYLWNAGMFIFNSNYMEKEIKKQIPSIHENIYNLPKIDSDDFKEKLAETYINCEEISIDYAIMEKCNDIYVIPSSFGWDDIGTWRSIERYTKKDENKNIIKGNAELVDSTNCVVYGNGKRIVAINVEDIYIIDGDDAIVVCNKENIDSVKKYRK